MAIPMPGPYEVPEIIQSILQRRREEARNAMLDKLQEEQARAGMDAQKRQLDLSQGHLDVARAGEQRAGETDAVQRRADEERIRSERLGRVAGYTPASEMPPDLVADARAAGMMQKGSYGGVEPDTGQSLDELLANRQVPEVFAGTPEFQQGELNRRRAGEYMGGLKDDDPLRAVMAAQMAGMQGIGPGDVRPVQHVYMSPEGKYGRAQQFPPGTQVTEGNWPPSAYQPNFTPFLAGGQLYNYNNRAGTLTPGPEVPGGITRVGTPDQTPDTGLQTAINNLRTTAGMQGARRDEALPAARAAVLAAASRTLPPDGQGLQALNYVVDSFNRATRTPTPADIPAAVASLQQMFPNLTPAEAQIIRDTLTGYLSVPLE